MPKIILEGQEIVLPEEHCQTDETIKHVLMPFYPAIAGAAIQRQIENGEEVIRIAKAVGTKGSVLETLLAADDALNPALELAWQLRTLELRGDLTLNILIALQDNLDRAVTSGSDDAQTIEKVVRALKSASPQPSQFRVIGV